MEIPIAASQSPSAASPSGIRKTFLPGAFITNPGTVASEPVVTVYGSGTITLMIGMTLVDLENIDGSITLDTPLQEAYKGLDSLNSAMNGDFPLLQAGTNAVSWTGNVSRVEIQPNWRFLV